MKKYFSCYNNGVTAIVSEETYNDIQKQNAIQRLFSEREKDITFNEQWRTEMAHQGLKHLLVPIFTFSQPDRFKESLWLTGDISMREELRRFIEEKGGVLERGSFYVPFSNGCELGFHGKDAMKSELAYVTTEQQFRETFGITVSELKERVRVTELAGMDEIVRLANKQTFGDNSPVR